MPCPERSRRKTGSLFEYRGGSVFGYRDSAIKVQVALFSVIAWLCFQLSKTFDMSYAIILSTGYLNTFYPTSHLTRRPNFVNLCANS